MMTFKEFVASKPADETYDYCDSRNCPYAQYLKATGQAKRPSVVPGSWHDMSSDARGVIDESIDNALNPNQRVFGANWTFGALLERLG